MTTKFCTSCRHCFVPPSGPAFARCLEPRAEFTSAVTGEVLHYNANDTRIVPTRCGPDANWFEAKEAVAA